MDAAELSPNDAQNPTTFIIRQPPEIPVPDRIVRLTGIGKDHAGNAIDAYKALDALLASAAKVAQQNRMTRCPVVIHYARFEMGFLSEIYNRTGHTSPLPFHVVCTHKIASRLMPELPRKGIRAVAGFLGHGAPSSRRCAPHLLATRHIWRHLITLLADQADVHSLDQLDRWLEQPPTPASPRRYPMPRDQRLGLPDSPGIYRMMRSNGDVLYVGKSTSLKKRINSYFQKRRHAESTLEMLTQAFRIDVTLSETALEAALIESDAIKSCNPPYNIALTRRHRGLFFVSRNFAAHSADVTEACSLGPVPLTAPFTAIHAMGLYLKSKGKARLDIAEILAMPVDHLPDRQTFVSGLEVFRQTHRSVLQRLEIIPALLHIGRLSWRSKRIQMELTEETSAESDRDHTGDQGNWSPESVVSCLESICRRCGFMLRRARWFSMLSESTVAWRDRSASQDRLNILMLHRGDMKHRDQIATGSIIPNPLGRSIPYADRRAGIDLMRYDRLRVLTTELRRLISEDRLECLRLGDRAYLYSPQVRRLLQWI